MPGFDAFDGSSFTLRSLTNSLRKAPYKPSRLGEMGLFTPQGSRTVSIVVEEHEGVLSVVPTQRRGGPATLKRHAKRNARSFECTHLPYEDRVLADEVQDVRMFGSEDQLQTPEVVVNDRLVEMRQDIETTHEWLRMGALTGNILDADGSTVIYNLFTEFGVIQQVHDMTFGTTALGQTKGLELKRLIESALGAAPYDHVHVLCSPTFFDNLVKHADVIAAYERWQNGQFNRDDPRFRGFEFPAGVIWEEYRQSVNAVGTLDFIADGDARAFPVGVPSLFKMYFAPATFVEAVNTVGIEMYAKQARDKLDQWIDLHVQSNPLPMCHRPRTLIRVFSST